MEGENSGFLARFDMGIEEIILLGIIILNVFDVLEIISPEWDYVKKIISWTALGMILYKAQLSKLFSGVKKPVIDGLLLSGFFLLIFKDLISYAKTALEAMNQSFLQDFFSVLVSNAVMINIVTLYLGIIVLLFASIRLSFIPLSESSSLFKVLGIEQKENHQHSFMNFSKRTFFIFILVIAFFTIVFNLLMQWLAIAVDAPLLMIAIISYVVIMLKKHRKLSAQKFLFKFGNFGETFYKKFLYHLKDKRSALRIVSGMLVLHLLTDALTYLMPLLFGIGDDLYLSLIPVSHTSLWFMISNQLSLVASQGILYSMGVVYVYLLSLFSLIVLLGGPILLMMGVYSHKSFKLPVWSVSLFFSSLIPFWGLTLIKISSLRNLPLFGVDFYVQELQNISLLISLSIISLLVFFILFFVFSRYKKLKVYLDSFFIVVLQIWFVIYMGLYSYSVMAYFIDSTAYLFSGGVWMLFGFFVITGVITALFYLVGTVFFVEDTHRNSHKIIKESFHKYSKRRKQRRLIVKK